MPQVIPESLTVKSYRRQQTCGNIGSALLALAVQHFIEENPNYAETIKTK